MVDEEHAVEMVDLVLQAGREQALGLDLAARARLVLGSGPSRAPGG